MMHSDIHKVERGLRSIIEPVVEDMNTHDLFDLITARGDESELLVSLVSGN